MSFLVELPEELYSRKAFDDFAAGSAFDLGTARALAWLSQLSYESDQPKIERRLHDWGLELVVFFRRAVTSVLPLVATNGLIARGRGTTLIAFAGTDPLVAANWITDFDILPSPAGLHHGFERAAEAGWTDIRDALAPPAAGSERLLITGHSLGAALAAVSAARILRELGIAADAVHVFGMPRAGGMNFARDYELALGARTFRLVHGDDVVATVPPSGLGYRHVGRLLACVRHGRFALADLASAADDDPPFAPILARGLVDGLRDMLSGHRADGHQPTGFGRTLPLLPPPIADHLPDRYCAALEAETTRGA